MSEELIKSVVYGLDNQVSVPRKELNHYIQMISSILDNDEYEFDKNGYQIDFWVQWSVGEKKYILAGDLWYNETFNFYVEA